MEHNKIEAIYAVREAAERKTRLQMRAEAHPSQAARDELLAAQLTLEASTQDAIEACHQCGHTHGAHEPHRSGNVIEFPQRGGDGNAGA